MKLVRGSEIQDFLRCRLRWNYAWVEQIKPKRPDGKLFLGTLFHKFLEAHYNNLDDWDSKFALDQGYIEMKKMFEETDTSRMEQSELDELWNLVSTIAANYHKQWDQQDEGWKVIATELTFAIPLDDDLVYTGTIDLIWLDQDGKLWFADHKTVSSISDYADNAVMDRQISRYFWALQQLSRRNGYIWDSNINEWIQAGSVWSDWFPKTEPHGFLYNLILKDVPVQPEPLKKGGLSKAKNQKTTYKIYRDALIELRKNDPTRKPENMVMLSEGYMVPEEYMEILDHLKAQETPEGNRFFRRVNVFRNEHEIQAAVQEFYATSQDMEYVQKASEGINKPLIYRNINDKCSWDCVYKSLCMASLDGSNVDLIKNLAYEKREERVADKFDLPTL